MTHVLTALYDSEADVRGILRKRNAKDVRRIAGLLGLQEQWVKCSFAVKGNRKDLESMIASETETPARFLRRGLTENPRRFFEEGRCSKPMLPRRGFWMCRGMRAHKFAKEMDPSKTFDAVVHFVQSGAGTGVHVGNGMILTCAHVVGHEDDDTEASSSSSCVPKREGRVKHVMFPNGIIYPAVCVVALESESQQDVAVLKITSDTKGLPFANIASASPEIGGRIVCVGNPSNINLEREEEEDDETIDFEPPVWHASAGQFRGRFDREKELGDIMHTCWTYWGHSGAPLFDEHGHVVGLHNSWDDRCGMRHGVGLWQIRDAMKRAHLLERK